VYCNQSKVKAGGLEIDFFYVGQRKAQVWMASNGICAQHTYEQAHKQLHA
jgi:hypothetical protein